MFTCEIFQASVLMIVGTTVSILSVYRMFLLLCVKVPMPAQQPLPNLYIVDASFNISIT